NLVAADAYHLVGTAFGLVVCPRVVRIDRADGVAGDHADGRALLLEIAPGPAHGAPRARSAHEVRDSACGLLPDLRAGRAVVHVGVDRVVVLVREDRVRVRRRDGAPLHDVVVRLGRRDRGRRDDHLGPEGAEQTRLFL